MEGIEGAMNTVMNNASATTSHTRMQDREATIPQWAPGDSFTVLGIESSCDETGVGITRVTIQDDGSPQGSSLRIRWRLRWRNIVVLAVLCRRLLRALI